MRPALLLFSELLGSCADAAEYDVPPESGQATKNHCAGERRRPLGWRPDIDGDYVEERTEVDEPRDCCAKTRPEGETPLDGLREALVVDLKTDYVDQRTEDAAGGSPRRIEQTGCGRIRAEAANYSGNGEEHKRERKPASEKRVLASLPDLPGVFFVRGNRETSEECRTAYSVSIAQAAEA